MSNLVEVLADKAVADNYQSYAKYVLETRALPQINDGLKLVQRRIIYGASKLPQKLIKTAALAGDVMKLHPHGDCTGSIYTMTNPCNRLKIFNIKGNHGGYAWGPSAGRYTECYLNDVGRFNFCQFIDYAEYHEGELGIPEPVSLPCLIPYALIEGSSGMGVGLSSEVLPMNIMDLIECYKDYIRDGKSDRLVRPDFGDYIIHDTQYPNFREWINSPKCSIKVNPVLTREGDSVTFTTLMGKSIDKVIQKIACYDNIDFRNESGAVGRYVFNVFKPTDEINPENLYLWLEYHTKNTPSFSRTMVSTKGVAVYSSLDTVIKSSLETLNKAIDKMIQARIDAIQYKLQLYYALRLAKDKKLFNDLANKSVEDLIKSMTDIGIEYNLAKDISKKPISYLTRSHDDEEEALKKELDEYINHNRTEYLIKLYDTFKDMINDDYYSKSHSILESQLLKNPRIRLINNGSELEIYDGKRGGIRMNSLVYLVDKNGHCDVKAISGNTCKVIPLDAHYAGMTTNFYKYMEIQTKYDKKGITVTTESMRYSKDLLNLEDGEKVENVVGWHEDDAPDRVKWNVVTKRSKARWY